MPARPRIAVPQPTSHDLGYNGRCWPQYAEAIRHSGGEAVSIPLSARPDEIVRLISGCHGTLLPGSPADVNPSKYGEERNPASSPADVARENIDELLLEDAFSLRKPLLGICFGLQSLNVWRGGALIQDLPATPLDHAAGPEIAVAHPVTISPGSVLESLNLAANLAGQHLPVNSSHHQAISTIGDNLFVSARSVDDGVVEAIQGGPLGEDSRGHFVVAVQWHPERSFPASPFSRALFLRFIAEAAAWEQGTIHADVDPESSYAARP